MKDKFIYYKHRDDVITTIQNIMFDHEFNGTYEGYSIVMFIDDNDEVCVFKTDNPVSVDHVIHTEDDKSPMYLWDFFDIRDEFDLFVFLSKNIKDFDVIKFKSEVIKWARIDWNKENIYIEDLEFLDYIIYILRERDDITDLLSEIRANLLSPTYFKGYATALFDLFMNKTFA